MYSLGTWFVSGIRVSIPYIKETMMMMMMMMIIIIIIIISSLSNSMWPCERLYNEYIGFPLSDRFAPNYFPPCPSNDASLLPPGRT